MEIITKSHLCPRTVRCRIACESEKEEAIRPKTWRKGTDETRKWENKEDRFLHGKSLRIFYKGVVLGMGWLQSLTALCYTTAFVMGNGGGFTSKWWGYAMALELPRQDNMAETDRLRSLVWSYTSCVILDKFFDLSEDQLHHLRNEEKDLLHGKE